MRNKKSKPGHIYCIFVTKAEGFGSIDIFTDEKFKVINIVQKLMSSNKKWPFVGVETVPAMTSLQVTSSCGILLNTLHTQAAKFNIKKFHRYLESGMEEDDYKEIMNSIQTSAHNYDTETEAIF